MTAPAQQLLARAGDWGRAPSAHNTQPWQVHATGPETLWLGWHADRVLEVGDPTRRDLMLSLGCVAEALAIVGTDLGYTVQVTPAVDRATRLAALVHLRPLGPTVAVAGAGPGPGATTGPSEPPAGLGLTELRARRTARGPYAEPGVSPEVVAQVGAEAARPDRGAPALVVLPPGAVQAALREADRWTFDGPATGELRDWLRLDRGDPRYHQDGLSDVALGLSRWEAAGLSLALRPGPLTLLRRTRLSAVLARTATARPLGTVVALTAGAGCSDDDLVELGRDLLRVWLAAGRHGLSAHPLSQLLDAPASASRVAAMLAQDGAGATRRSGSGSTVPGTAYAVFRLGVPRRPADASHRLTDDG